MGKRRADWGVGIEGGYPQPPCQPSWGVCRSGGPLGAPRGGRAGPRAPRGVYILEGI